MKKLLILFILILASVAYLLSFSTTKREQWDPNFKEETFTRAYFNLGDYKKCKVYSRSNMNIPSGATTLIDKSEIRCEVAGESKVLLSINDSEGFENAKNSIYRIWYDSEGYKALIVDQNGAGSGEGTGKILLLSNPNYKLISCFYYIPEDFVESSGKSYAYDEPLTEELYERINQKLIPQESPNCSNFTYISNFE